MTIEVQLHGANGTRTTAVDEPKGMYTRHVKAPREAVPSLFGDVSIKRQATPPVKPTPEPENPLGDSMKALLAEIDEIMKAETKPRANTAKEQYGYHYTGWVKPKPDYDSAAFQVWNAIRERRNTEYIDWRASKGVQNDA